MNGHTQTGLVLGASVADYEKNIVRKHEHTRPDKENDRVRHIEATRAQTGKVLLVHPRSEVVDAEIAHARSAAANTSFTADDGIKHELWVIDDPSRIERLQQAFRAMGSLYIADGHHRSAAASRVARAQRQAGGTTVDTEMFVAVSFPANEVRIMPYNRVVHDLNGRSARAFIAEVRERFDVSEVGPRPRGPVSSGCSSRTPGTPYGSANATCSKPTWCRASMSVCCKIACCRRCSASRIRAETSASSSWVAAGGDELVKRVRALTRGDAVSRWPSVLHPTSIDDLFAIADRDQPYQGDLVAVFALMACGPLVLI